MPRRIMLDVAGRRVGALDWGGAGPDLVYLHANGFCAGFFEPVAVRLTDRFRCVGIDLAGHGATELPCELSRLTMVAIARQALGALDALGFGERPVRVVGQSLGGITGVLIDRERPGAISHLILCEAVIFDGPPDLPADRPNLAEVARRRRANWQGRHEMRERYAARPPLADLHPDALEAYLRYGTRDRPDGGVELACAPEVEGEIFEMTPTERGSPPAWDHLRSLDAEAVVVSGDRSDLPSARFAEQAARAGCPHVVVPGGHLFLQEDPAAAAELLTGLLGDGAAPVAG